MRERLAALLLEVDGAAGGYGGEERKKLTPEEIERKRKEAEELGEKCRTLSKKERSEMNKSRKEKAGHRLAKTGSKSRKFEGEGATSKEEKKKKNQANVKKRFGLAASIESDHNTVSSDIFDASHADPISRCSNI
eukprot:symbB.v1.2.033599.t1/scaffold4196.1/size83517/7